MSSEFRVRRLSTGIAAQELCDVLAQCLMKSPADRPSAERLLAHRFFSRRAARDAPALVSGLLLRLSARGAGPGPRLGIGLGPRQRSGRMEASWGSEADLQRLADSSSGSASRSGPSGEWMGARESMLRSNSCVSTGLLFTGPCAASGCVPYAYSHLQVRAPRGAILSVLVTLPGARGEPVGIYNN